MAHSELGPAHGMNMTPLIDVLLVLLVMFVLTIPAATNTLPIDLPAACSDCVDFDPIANTFSIDAQDRLAWNGAAIEPDQLLPILVATKALAVEPELRFTPAARASYEAASHTMAVIRSSGVSRFGFVGNEAHRIFSRG